MLAHHTLTLTPLTCGEVVLLFQQHVNDVQYLWQLHTLELQAGRGVSRMPRGGGSGGFIEVIPELLEPVRPHPPSK